MYKMAECNFRASGAIKLKLLGPYPCEGCVCVGLLHGAQLESSMPCKTLVCDADFALYKLFSSIRVWSSTWCMPKFSSLAWASFSVGRGKQKGQSEKTRLLESEATLTIQHKKQSLHHTNQ